MGERLILENYRQPAVDSAADNVPLVSMNDRKEFLRQLLEKKAYTKPESSKSNSPKELHQKLVDKYSPREEDPISPTWGIAEPSAGLKRNIPGMPGPDGSSPDIKHVGTDKGLYQPNQETPKYPVEFHKYKGILRDGAKVDTQVVLFPDPEPTPGQPVLKIFQEVNICYDKPQTLTLPTTPPGGKPLTLKDVTCVHVYKLSDQSEVILFEPPKLKSDGTMDYNEVSSVDGHWEARENVTGKKIPNTHRSGFRRIENL